jgi:hypothetical protein
MDISYKVKPSTMSFGFYSVSISHLEPQREEPENGVAENAQGEGVLYSFHVKWLKLTMGFQDLDLKWFNSVDNEGMVVNSFMLPVDLMSNLPSVMTLEE